MMTAGALVRALLAAFLLAGAWVALARAPEPPTWLAVVAWLALYLLGPTLAALVANLPELRPRRVLGGAVLAATLGPLLAFAVLDPGTGDYGEIVFAVFIVALATFNAGIAFAATSLLSAMQFRDPPPARS
jgi:hypothetical protein